VLKRFPAKWTPVRVKKTRQNKKLEPRSDSIGTEKALDEELEKRSQRFARYAEDCNIHVRSQKAGERVLAGIERFLEKRLSRKTPLYPDAGLGGNVQTEHGNESGR
jgi:retron-type reverse transcriptase